MSIKIDKRDKIFSLIIRTRDNWTCTRCGKRYEPPTQALHCSHFYGRRHRGTRWDEMNAFAHCYGCHQFLGSNPEIFREWVINRIGQDEFDKLQYRHRTITKYTKAELELLYQDLKRRLATLN